MAWTECNDYKYKIILLGAVGVGKTSIFNRLKTGKFVPNSTEQTHGTDIYNYTMTVGNDRIKAQLWDTGGAERFRTLTSNYYRDANGAFLVYCGEDIYTFESLQQYIEEASFYVDMNTFVWAIIGSKADLQCDEIEKDRIEAHCTKLQTTLSYSVSAKTGENITKAFDELIIAIHNRWHSYPHKPSVVSIENTHGSNKQKSCC